MLEKIGGSTHYTGVMTLLGKVRDYFNISINQAKIDLLENRLRLYYESDDESSIYEAIRVHNIDDLAIDNECVLDYELVIKDRLSNVNYDVIYNLIITFGKQLEQNFNEISSLQSKMQMLLYQERLPNVMTLREIHDQLMPDKNLNYLRNLLAKNRRKEKNLWKSHLVLGRFSLRFEKPVGTKIWYIYRREFIEVRKER